MSKILTILPKCDNMDIQFEKMDSLEVQPRKPKRLDLFKISLVCLSDKIPNTKL